MKKIAPFDSFIKKGGTPVTVLDSQENALWSAKILVTDTRYVYMMGTNRADLILGYFPSSKGDYHRPHPGMVIKASSSNLPESYYVIAKVLHVTNSALFDPGYSVSMLAMPKIVTFARPSDLLSYSQRDVFDEPLVPPSPETNVTIHCGFANNYDPSYFQSEGQLPMGTWTIYAPLGVDVRLEDEVLIDNDPWTVSQTNKLFADGQDWAKQIILSKSVLENIA